MYYINCNNVLHNVLHKSFKSSELLKHKKKYKKVPYWYI
jgi:hypothetical protein